MESILENALMDSELIRAAVLIPLVVNPCGKTSVEKVLLKTRRGEILLPKTTEVILTVRTHTVEHHKGQISFPGGAFEPHDQNLEETALRETHEEIGLDKTKVQLVTELPEVPTMASRFRVSPFVGIIHGRPELQANPHEIGEILFVPLAHLLDPRHSHVETHERAGMRYQIRAYQFGTHRIWGATGLILQILLEKFLLAHAQAGYE
ncbi:MAG: CoA pyrophosphatase [Bdellovibrionota bacterium]